MNTEKIKILHLITGLEPGGTQMVLARLLKSMDGCRFDNVIVTMKSGGIYEERVARSGVRIRSLGMSTGGRDVFSGFKNLRNIIKEEKPALISAWMYHANIAASLSRVFCSKIPIIWNIRHSLHDISAEEFSASVAIKIGRLISKHADAIVYNSELSAKQHGEYGYTRHSSCIIPNGYDCEEFSPHRCCRENIHQVFNIPCQSSLVAHIGRYHKMKDHENMIRAASLLKKERNDVYFILIGDNIDDRNTVLMDLIDRHCLRNSVSLIGDRCDLNRLMPSFDIVVSSSSYGEGFSNTISEAMACGVPCVVTDVGDSAAIVGDAGRVVPPRDSFALAKAIDDLLSLDSINRSALGAAARKRIIDNYSMQKMAYAFENLYRSVLSNK